VGRAAEHGGSFPLAPDGRQSGRRPGAGEYNLAELIEKGKGTKRDDAAAFKLYKQAADRGYAPAEEKVGRMYAAGTGVAADPAQAYFWSTLAAKQNEKNAEKRLQALAAKLSAEQASKVKQSADDWKPILAAK